MNRRQVIQTLGLVSTHALFPSVLSGFLSGCANKEVKNYNLTFFNPEEFNAIIEIIDFIIPETSTQSASQTNTHIFLDLVFSQCLTEEQQKFIKNGLSELIPGFNKAEDKMQFLADTDKKAYANNEDYAYFKFIKQYTLIGFFTSREGTTKASNYLKIPGPYKGEIPADENTLSYGKTSLRYYL